METPDTPEQRTPAKNASYGLSIGVGVGLPIGLVIGLLTDNIALWLCIGLAIGLGLGITYDEFQKKSAASTRVKIVGGATYALTKRSNPASNQRSHYWLGDNGQELELTDEEAAELL